MPKHVGYWKQYNSASKRMSPKQVFQTARSHTARLAPPWRKSKLGRPYRTQPCDYAALLLTARLEDWSTRDVEAASLELVGHSIDHASAAWALAKVMPGYFEALLWQLYRVLTGALTQVFHLADSTGVRTDRKRAVERVFAFGKEIEDLKFHVLGTWLPRQHAIAIASASCTSGECHDSPALRDLLRKTPLVPAPLFADKAYDAEDTFELAFEQHVVPVIKPHENWRKGFFRKKARRAWNAAAYRKYRSRIETVFAGSQARNSNRVRERLAATRRQAVILLAAAHNLRTAIRLGIQAIAGFIRQLRGALQAIYLLLVSCKVRQSYFPRPRFQHLQANSFYSVPGKG